MVCGVLLVSVVYGLNSATWKFFLEADVLYKQIPYREECSLYITKFFRNKILDSLSPAYLKFFILKLMGFPK